MNSTPEDAVEGSETVEAFEIAGAGSASADVASASASADVASAVAEPDRRDPDPRLLEAHDLALAALHEITPPGTVGPAAGFLPEDDGVVSLRFENRLAGYPGWYWTVSLARLEDAEPTVLEVELLPGASALLAPEWVPWAVRLAEYHAHQAALADDTADVDEGADIDLDDLQDALDELVDLDEESASDEDDVEDLDAADFDEDGSPILHAGDLDGVDIDELDEDADLDDED